jgi:hypothetical protein
MNCCLTLQHKIYQNLKKLAKFETHADVSVQGHRMGRQKSHLSLANKENACKISEINIVPSSNHTFGTVNKSYWCLMNYI